MKTRSLVWTRVRSVHPTIRVAIAGPIKKPNKISAESRRPHGLVEHAKGKWIGGAEKGIAQAYEALAAPKSDADRSAAMAELAKWQANKEERIKALKGTASLARSPERGRTEVARGRSLQAALAKAQAEELAAANAAVAELKSVVGERSAWTKLAFDRLLHRLHEVR